MIRLFSSCGNLYYVVLTPCFVIFKNVVHSLEPGETPRNSAFHQALNYAQLSYISHYILKWFYAVEVWFRSFFRFTSFLNCTYGLRVDTGGASTCRGAADLVTSTGLVPTYGFRVDTGGASTRRGAADLVSSTVISTVAREGTDPNLTWLDGWTAIFCWEKNTATHVSNLPSVPCPIENEFWQCFCYISPNQTQTHLHHFKVFDKQGGEILFQSHNKKVQIDLHCKK